MAEVEKGKKCKKCKILKLHAMSYEVKLKNKTIAIELQKRTEDRMTVKVDGRSVELGLVS